MRRPSMGVRGAVDTWVTGQSPAEAESKLLITQGLGSS